MHQQEQHYAVLMMGKINDWHKLTSAHMHNTRSIPCPSADPARKYLNREIVRPEGNHIKKHVQKRLAQAINGIRSNAVLCLELVLSASHEFFKTQDNDSSWVHANLEWVRAHFGEENIMSFAVHKDERTPHIHVLLTPITRHYHPMGADRLAASAYVGNRFLLRTMQDSYGEAMATFGLSRGVVKESTGAKHEKIKDFWDKKLKEEYDRSELDRAIDDQRARERELTALAQRASKVRTLVDVAERHADVLPLLDRHEALPKFLHMLSRNPSALNALETLYDTQERIKVPYEQMALQFIERLAPSPRV